MVVDVVLLGSLCVVMKLVLVLMLLVVVVAVAVWCLIRVRSLCSLYRRVRPWAWP